MNESKIVRDAKAWLPTLDPIFRRGVFVLHNGSSFLDSRFQQLVTKLTDDGTIACTSSVMDIMAAKSLRYERSTGQRCFAMYFRHHPERIGTRAATVGIIHEAGHHVSDRSPARDMADETAATKLWWTWRDTEPEHGRRWLRATAHLAWRAAAIGGIDVDFRLLFNAYAPTDAVMGSLRSEFRQMDKPIESILDSPAPEQFRQLCDLQFHGRLPIRKSRNSKATNYSTSASNRKPWSMGYAR